jgi:hypothetical protein
MVYIEAYKVLGAELIHWTMKAEGVELQVWVVAILIINIIRNITLRLGTVGGKALEKPVSRVVFKNGVL